MTCETFRYCWLKVTDEDARASSIRSALDLQESMMQRARDVVPGTPEAARLQQELDLARTYLGQDVDLGVRVVIVAHNQSATLQVLSTGPEHQSVDGIEIDMADMPPGFTREQAQAWIDTPVGSTWSRGAIACRLIYAVASADDEARMVAPAAEAESATRHA